MIKAKYERQGDAMDRIVLSLLVDNTAGVLARVASLFSRRGYNIESLTVGVTADERYSRMTVVSFGDQQVLEQIEKQLNKKLDVIKVKTLSQEQCYTRELMLLKVKYNKNNRRDIIEICDIMKTEIVDMSKHFMMLQICDSPEKIDTLIKMLQSISIVEVARTGTLALSKCAENDD